MHRRKQDIPKYLDTEYLNKILRDYYISCSDIERLTADFEEQFQEYMRKVSPVILRIQSEFSELTKFDISRSEALVVEIKKKLSDVKRRHQKFSSHFAFKLNYIFEMLFEPYIMVASI